MDELTKRFNEIIEVLDLSGVEISEKMQIHPPTLVKYKSGKSSMSLQTLYKFCKTFDVSADWLMGLTDDKPRLNNHHETK